jgi:hypothetical protein
MTIRASADSANHAVPGDETVRAPQNSINETEFKGIDVGVDYKSVLALAKATEDRQQFPLRSNLISFFSPSSAKPTEETALAGDELIESRQSGMR